MDLAQIMGKDFEYFGAEHDAEATFSDHNAVVAALHCGIVDIVDIRGQISWVHYVADSNKPLPAPPTFHQRGLYELL